MPPRMSMLSCLRAVDRCRAMFGSPRIETRTAAMVLFRWNRKRGCGQSMLAQECEPWTHRESGNSPLAP